LEQGINEFSKSLVLS